MYRDVRTPGRATLLTRLPPSSHPTTSSVAASTGSVVLPRAEIFVDGTNFDIAALALVGSSIDVPRFARELVTGGYDHAGNKRFVEKETDVNVAVHMLQGAYEDRYDTAVVITGDTDMVPAMKMVRGLGRRVVWCHFPSQAGIVDLRKVSDAQLCLDEQLLRPLKFLIIRR